jgi:hypothetical protein
MARAKSESQNPKDIQKMESPRPSNSEVTASKVFLIGSNVLTGDGHMTESFLPIPDKHRDFDESSGFARAADSTIAETVADAGKE